MFKVVCVGAFHRKGIKLLESRPDLVTYEVLTDLSPENVARGVAGADAVVVRTTPLPRETLERADRLRIVSRHGVGTDNVDVAYLSSRKIPMAIAIDSNVGSVAEHTLMMLLALAKDAMAGDRATRSGDFAWRDRRTASDVAGKSALIMGFGRIGQRVGALCRALGLRVAAFDPYMERSPVEGVEMVKDFRAILPETDFLCLHLPSTPETRDLIGAGELALLKRGAFVLNCARELAREGYTVIQTTHNPEHSYMFSDRILALRGGRVLTEGGPKEVLTPELMRELYGVEVEVSSLFGDRVRVCTPASVARGQ